MEEEFEISGLGLVDLNLAAFASDLSVDFGLEELHGIVHLRLQLSEFYEGQGRDHHVPCFDQGF